MLTLHACTRVDRESLDNNESHDESVVVFCNPSDTWRSGSGAETKPWYVTVVSTGSLGHHGKAGQIIVCLSSLVPCNGEAKCGTLSFSNFSS